MALKYSQKTIEHFTNPRNTGTLEGANATATEGSPACGDMVNYSLRINDETLIIEDIKFKSYGCASNIATASMATEMVHGKHIDEVKMMGTGEAADELGGLPPVKMHCSVLAINGIKAAIREYEKGTGRIKDEKREVSETIIRKVLTDVMHPKHGVSIITNNNVSKIQIEGGQKIYIVLELEPDDTQISLKLRCIKIASPSIN